MSTVGHHHRRRRELILDNRPEASLALWTIIHEVLVGSVYVVSIRRLSISNCFVFDCRLLNLLNAGFRHNCWLKIATYSSCKN